MIAKKAFQVRLLSQADKNQVESLLKSAFSSAKGFRTESIAERWTKTDDFYPCLGLFSDQGLEAYMRIEWISSDAEFRIKIGETEVPFEFSYPIGYLGKAATRPVNQSKGFNLILRYHALRILDYWRVSAVLGTMVEGSSRIQTMRHLGYYFFNKKRKWSGTFSSDKQVLLGVLSGSEKMSNAIEKIEAEFFSLLNQAEIQFSLSEVPMVGKVRMTFPWDKPSLKKPA